MAATHGLSEHFHHHPIRGVIELITLLGLAVATAGLVGFGTEHAGEPAPVAQASVPPAEEAENEAPRAQKKWVWKKRVSRDNPIYAFGER